MAEYTVRYLKAHGYIVENGSQTSIEDNPIKVDVAVRDDEGHRFQDWYATKTALASAISGIYKYAGSVNTFDLLPDYTSLSQNDRDTHRGEVYNVNEAYVDSSTGESFSAGSNFVYESEENKWKSLGSTVVGSVTTAQFTTAIANGKLYTNKYIRENTGGDSTLDADYKTGEYFDVKVPGALYVTDSTGTKWITATQNWVSTLLSNYFDNNNTLLASRVPLADYNSLGGLSLYSARGTEDHTLATGDYPLLMDKSGHAYTAVEDVLIHHDTTLTGDGTTSSNLGINLASANTWSGVQTFEKNVIGNSGFSTGLGSDTLISRTDSDGNRLALVQENNNGNYYIQQYRPLAGATDKTYQNIILPNKGGTIELTSDITNIAYDNSLGPLIGIYMNGTKYKLPRCGDQSTDSSVAIGSPTATATAGSGSVAVGDSSNATAQGVAVGRHANSTVSGGVAVGYYANSSNESAVAIGPNTISSAANSLAIGNAAHATSGAANIAIGNGAVSDGTQTTSIGNIAEAHNIRSVAVGNGCISNYDYSASFGNVAIADAVNSVAIGQNAYNNIQNSATFDAKDSSNIIHMRDPSLLVFRNAEINTNSTANNANIFTAYTGSKSLQDYLDAKQNTLTFDTTPTSGSANPVTSNGVYTADSTERTTANTEYVKNMLHLGYYDTYSVDSNGNYVVTRKTIYNDDGTQSKASSSWNETIPPRYYARTGQTYVQEHAKSEADRSSNLCNTFDRSNIPSDSSLYSATLNSDGSYTSTAICDYRAWRYSNSDFKFDLEPGTYRLSSIIKSSNANANMTIFDSNNNWLPHVFTLTSRTSVGIMVKTFTGSAYIMLNRGSHALPYQPYEGSIVHEKELTSDISTINSSIATTNTNVSTLDAQNVKLTGDQIIYGVKTFSGNTQLTNIVFTQSDGANHPKISGDSVRVKIGTGSKVLEVGNTGYANVNSFTFPDVDGTLALTTDIPALYNINFKNLSSDTTNALTYTPTSKAITVVGDGTITLTGFDSTLTIGTSGLATSSSVDSLATRVSTAETNISNNTATITTAKNDAISTAAADATTKANNALASAKSYSDTNLVTAKSYTDTQITSAISSALKYKGTVDNYSDLPTSASVGDTYNVVNANGNIPAGTNYAWNGTSWDALGGNVDLSGYETVSAANTSHAALQTNIDSANTAISTENTRAKAAESTNATAISTLDGNTVKLSGDQTIAGTKTFSSTITGSVSGNAGTATKLATSRTIGLTGTPSSITSTPTAFDGSANISIPVSIADVSTTVSGLMSAADKVKLNGIATGATANTGTVTSLTLTQGTGITVSNSGTAITTSGTRTITLNSASDTTIGGIKVGTVLTSAVSTSVTSIANRYYPVQRDSNSLGFVNIPSRPVGILVGSTSTTVLANSDNASLTFVQGSNIALSYDSANSSSSEKRIVIAASGLATSSDLTSLTTRVSTAETNISSNTAAIATAKSEAISTAEAYTDTALGERIDAERTTANDEYVKNMLHLGYYDTYTKDSNGNYIVTRQTGYANLKELTWTTAGSLFFCYSLKNIKYVSANTDLGSIVSSEYKNHTASGMSQTSATGCIAVDIDKIVVNTGSTSVIPSGYIQYKLSTSYTETYEPNHFARIEPYALEYAKSEADRSSNLAGNMVYAIGSINSFGVSASSTTRVRCENYVPVKPNTKYILSATLNGTVPDISVNEYSSGLSAIQEDTWSASFYTFITSSTTYFIRFKFRYTGGATEITSVSLLSNVMLNTGSYALPYQPYEGEVVHESGLTKSAVGLSNVDNTADKDKPVSTATQAALDGKQNTLTIDTALSDTSANPIANSAVSKAIGGLAKVATSGSYNDLTDKPTLFSGSYNDLTDKPTIDSALSETSTNAVQNSVATQAIKKAQGTTIKVLGNASDFFDVFFLNQYTSPVHSTVIKFELKNAVSLSLQTTYDFKKPILTKAVLVKRVGADFEDRYPLVISGLSKRSDASTTYDSDYYEMFSISEMLYTSLTGASDITGTSDWYFLFTFEEME